MEDETKLMDAIHSNAHENHCDYVIANNRAKIRKEKEKTATKK